MPVPAPGREPVRAERAGADPPRPGAADPPQEALHQDRRLLQPKDIEPDPKGAINAWEYRIWSCSNWI